SGSADSVGMHLQGTTSSVLDQVWFAGWRGHAIYADNFVDSSLRDVRFDFCGSATDDDRAVYHADGETSDAYPGDSIKWMGHCRMESCGDRLVELHDTPKYEFFGTKFENMQQDSNGMGGDGTDGAQFLFD